MADQIVYNGNYFAAGDAIVSAQSRGLRYGDGCFETMKIVDGKIALKQFHFERLFSSLDILQFQPAKHFATENLEKQILDLAGRNDHSEKGRVRLCVFRSEGGLYDAKNQFPNYIIETFSLDPNSEGFNENGLVIDIYREAKKVADNFSHIKSNSFLPYIMAADWAEKNKLNDAILLNPYDRIADTTIANVFIVSNGIIKTPSLNEGCIGGVMRKYLVRSCKEESLPIEETHITVEDLNNANEVFLTNAIRGIRWVKQIGENSYPCNISKLLYQKFIKTLWH